MSRSKFKASLYSASLAVLAAVGLNIACATAGVASPEDEIARLNRVRANLFEELVKARAEMATARSELEAALKARDAAEAEIARLRQVTASANPVPSAETKAQPQRAATTAAPMARRQSVRSAAPAATGSVAKPVRAGAQRRVARTSAPLRVTARQSEAASRQAAPVAQAQDLPSVLRLQDPR